LAAVREARGPELASGSDRPSVPEARAPELVSGSCRRRAREVRDQGPAQANDRGLLTGLVLESAPVSALVSGLVLPDSGRPICRVSAAERAWGVEIELRTCPRRAVTAPPVSRIAWPIPAATE
jgi:hypothetical protein